jgi:hypothetical protein
LGGTIINSQERQAIIANSPISFRYLKRFNLGAGILQLINGVAMLALTLTLTWPKGTDIYTFYIKFTAVATSAAPIVAIPDPQVLFTNTA